MRKGMLRSQNGEDLSEVIPYEYILSWIRVRERLRGIDNRVLILKSETASGKSTLLPPKIYETFVNGKDRGIICTQPRVLTAIANVRQMLANYKFLRLEDNVGWSTKEDKLKPKRVGLLSATIGTLTAQLKSMTDEEIAAKYRFIMIDETHERSLETDMAMAMLKGLVTRMRDKEQCPFVILMSATFEPESFLKYYGVPAATNFIWCVGEAAGQDLRLQNGERTHSDIIRGALACIEEILEKGTTDEPNRGDVLVFMPGGGEMTALKKAIVDKFGFTLDMKVLELDSGAVEKNTPDFRAITEPLGDYKRRVILSTAVAETGVTIDSLKYVIDAGMSREMEFHPMWHVSGLLTKPAPLSRVIQRKGRAGRKFRGVFYPLYPTHIMSALPVNQLPTILTTDVTPIILDLIVLQLREKYQANQETVFDPTAISLVDVPSADGLAWAMEQMWELGFLTVNPPPWKPGIAEALAMPHVGTNLTGKIGLSRTGAIAACLTGMELTPQACAMLFSAKFWQAGMQDVISICAYISLGPSQGMTLMPGGVNWDLVYSTGGGHKQRHLVQCEICDGVYLYNAIRNTSNQGLTPLVRWCKDANIDIKFASRLISQRDAIYALLLEHGFDVGYVPTNIRALKHVIYEGYRCMLVTERDGRYWHRNAEVFPPEWVLATKCKHFIASGFGLTKNKKSRAMEVTPILASVLDGYVPTA